MQATPSTQGPLIIGGTGGSGTRAVAKLLIQSGQVYLGRNHNKALDCLDFKSLYDRYIPDFLPHFYAKQNLDSIDSASYSKLTTKVSECLELYLKQIESPLTQPVWGWKGPRSLFLLPLLHSIFPTMKYLHLIRDGRDMAYSLNQNQLRLYGQLSLAADVLIQSPAQQSIALWQKANLTAAEYANSTMPNQYLCIRYEDLVFKQEETINKLADFIQVSPENLLACQDQIRASSGCGRWKKQSQEDIDSIVDSGSTGLYYFGYK